MVKTEQITKINPQAYLPSKPQPQNPAPPKSQLITLATASIKKPQQKQQEKHQNIKRQKQKQKKKQQQIQDKKKQYKIHVGMERDKIFIAISQLIADVENGHIRHDDHYISIDPCLKQQAINGDLPLYKLLSTLSLLILKKSLNNPDQNKKEKSDKNNKQDVSKVINQQNKSSSPDKANAQNKNKQILNKYRINNKKSLPKSNVINQNSKIEKKNEKKNQFIDYNLQGGKRSNEKNKQGKESKEGKQRKQEEKVNRSKSKLNGQFNVDFVINSMEIIFKKQSISTIQSCGEHDAFWVTKSLWVRLLKNQAFQFLPKINTKGILAIYGRVKVKFFNYLVTPTCFSNTLDQQIEEFKQAFPEQLICKHIKQLYISCSGIQGTVSNSFDALTLNKVILDFQGNALVDIASYRPAIDNQQKKRQFFYLSPEVLLQNKRSEKNDVWSLGVIALSLLLGKRISTQIQAHPYNNEKQIISKSLNKQLIKNKFIKLNKIRKIIQAEQKISKIINNKSLMIEKMKPRQNLKHSQLARFDGENKVTMARNSFLSDLSSHQSKYVDSNLRSKMLLDISDSFYELLEDCLEFEEEKRPNWSQLLSRHKSILGNQQNQK